MGTVAKSRAGSDFKPVPSGTHIAVCTAVVDLGLQAGSDKFPKPREQVYLRWEIPSETVTWKDADGNDKSGAAVIGKTYTLSLNEKAALRRDLESWRGRSFTDAELVGFDVKNVLGKACQLGVVHNESGGKTYANIAAVMGLPKGISAPSPSHEPLYYSVDAPNPAVYDKLPGWLREKIDGRIPPPKKEAQEAGSEADFDDALPF